MLRKIPLNGWNNPEGVAVLEDGYLAITDERLHDLTLVKVDGHTAVLNHADFKSYDLGQSVKSNKGFEAVAWDPLHQRLVIGEERPPKLYTWNTDGRSQLKGDKQPLPSDQLDLRNLSALVSTRVQATCWSCRPTPTCCWSWTSRGSRSAS